MRGNLRVFRGLWMRGKNLLGTVLSMSFKNVRSRPATLGLLAMAVALPLLTTSSTAQTGGQGAIQGTVTDSTGAVMANVNVTATNKESGVATTRPTSSAGL